MSEFTPYKHCDAYVTALQLTSDTERAIVQAIVAEAVTDELALLEITSDPFNGYTITYRYKHMNTPYVLTEGMYAVSKSDGTYAAMSAEDFLKIYSPSEVPEEPEVPTPVVPTLDTTNTTQDTPTEDLNFVVKAPINRPVSLKGKSVTISSLALESTYSKLTAMDGDVNLTNVSNLGNLSKGTANAAFSLASPNTVVVSGGTIAQSGYNCFEVGLSTEVAAPSSVLIENVDFTADLSNNAILLFAHAEGAVVTIRNCTFNKVSNVLRISNRDNTNVTINIEDCTVTAWETNLAYTGLILCQDYTAGSVEAAATDNRFAPDKVTINLRNVTGPNGKIMVPADMSTVLGSGTADQLLYVYSADALVPYDATRFPTVNIF